MKCMICDGPSTKTIGCKKHEIEFALCEKHAGECNTCSECQMSKRVI